MTLVVALSTVIALPLAWLVTCTDIRFPRAITWLAATAGRARHVMACAAGWQRLLDQLFDLVVASPAASGALIALTLYTYLTCS